MKKIINLSLLCFTLVIMNSCRPDNDFSIGQTQDRVAQLAGTWRLQTVIQTDINAKSKNFVDAGRPEINVQQMDITTAAPFTDLKLTLTETAGNVPTTFAVDYGNAPRIFKNTGGTWIVDNMKTPGTLKLINGTDTVTVKLGNVNSLGAGFLTLQRIKYQGVKPKIQYDYNFIKI